MTSKHTPGPWHLDETFVDGQWGNPSHWICEVVGPDNSRIVADIPEYRTYEEDAAELEANARLIAAAPELLEALEGLLDDVYGLMRESEGVAGLHLNGDVADWASLDEGGRFERLSNMSAARAAIDKATVTTASLTVAPRGEHPLCPGCLDTECNGECMENL